MHVNGLDRTTFVLTIIGGLNWGLIGIFNFNLVDSIFGEDSALSRIIYTIVGVSTVYLIARALQLSNRGATQPTKVER